MDQHESNNNNGEGLPGGEADDALQSIDHHNDDDRSFSHTGDGASPGKIFIGGLARETTPAVAQFIKHFGKYGEITDSVIMKDRKTGQPRGFGFVTYADPSVVDQVIQDTHIINGKQVEIKRTIPRGAAGPKDFKTKKIFVGGIPSAVTEDDLKEFFSQFGSIAEHQILRDHSTNRSRGFGFVTFEEEDAVDELLTKGNRLEFAGTQVEIKKAEPKKPNPPTPSFKRYGDSRSTPRGGYGDTYGGLGGHAYGGGGGSANLYRSGGGAYGGGRMSAYGGYGAGEYGGGGYGGGYGGGPGGGGGIGGPYRGEPSVGYSGRYGGGGGGGYSRGGYDMGGGGYGAPADSYGSGGGGGYMGGAPGPAGGYGAGGYDAGLGGGYGGGGSASGGGSFYGSRGGYGSSSGGYGSGGAGAGRYHPYGR
ncbi:unnamed protein product [Linum tenue]|uniref:RRM domain-containing protein n=1 Tax=Linum tenue TaxID=586396 RepID=A0AAV0NCY1_9ROSI|nr:unnamed protein product [Linum tenue]